MITHLSPSSIETWGRCQEQWRRVYVEGDRRPPGIALHIGGGAHKGIEVNHKQKILSHKDEPLDVLQDAARDAYIERVKDLVYFPPDELSEAKTQINNGLNTTVKLIGLYHQALAPQIQPVEAEEPHEMDDPELPLPVMGIPDVQTDEGWLPDIKTSEKKWPAQKAETSIQATIYHELVKPKRQTFEILTKTKKAELQSIEVQRNSNDWAALKVRIKAMLRSINAGIFQPAAPDSWLCSPKWCGFFWTCGFIASHRKIWRPK